MPFPSPPWTLRGDLWLSVFPVRSRGTASRPPGLYGAAFVDYSEDGVLAYRELLVARVVRDGAVPRVHITDIWVDSEASRDGGRALWAIPKELAVLYMTNGGVGPVLRTSWAGQTNGGRLAHATFTGPRAAGVRTPFAFSTQQQREDGATVVAGVSGSARTLPCLATWRFDTDGPLAWMAGRRAVMSLRVSDFRLTFGR